MAKHELTDISGIGPSSANALSAGGFTSVGSLAGASIEALTAVSGFGPVRARTVRAAARELLAAESDSKKDKKKRKKKKKKKKKKDKKKRKKEKKKK